MDDERPVREFLAAALEQGGHRVVQAIHGRHALDLLAGSAFRVRPDLVISDVMMPMVGGVELCRVLKADRATRTIPIVLMSAAARQVPSDARADAYIGKPFDLDTMDELVRRMLSIGARSTA
ncbi:MAG: response regulator [Chloroflexota bacterium]|nr:response regulator [Chloroflexota bacterium]